MSNENIVLARNTERAPKHPLAAQTVLSQPLDNW